MEETYMLFASEEDIENYIQDKTVEDFEGGYETLIIKSKTDWLRAIELTKRYGDYCCLDENEYLNID